MEGASKSSLTRTSASCSLSLQKEATDRAELLSGASTSTAAGPSSSATYRRPPGVSSSLTASDVSESPFRTPTPNYPNSYDHISSLRESHALREHSFVQQTHSQLDDFIAQGREVLDNLVDQRNMLKGTQRRLLDAANTLGLSRDVIGWIERRR